MKTPTLTKARCKAGPWISKLYRQPQSPLLLLNKGRCFPTRLGFRCTVRGDSVPSFKNNVE